MNREKLEFENWYDIFIDSVRSLGYHGPVDRDSGRMDYDNNLEPEEAAKSLVEELNS